MTKKVISVLIIVFLLTVGFNQIPSANAAPASIVGCVSGAGSAQVNGTYNYGGTFNGNPFWQHETNTIFLFKGNLNRYQIADDMTLDHSAPHQYYYTNNIPPYGGWVLDTDGHDPVPVLNEGRCSEVNETLDKPGKTDPIVLGSSIQTEVGTGGVSSPVSGMTGTLQVVPLASSPALPDFKVHKAYNVTILDAEGQVIQKHLGLLYLYFNLTEKQVELLNAGELSIMKHTLGVGWSDSFTFFAGFEDTGRAATFVFEPGIYALVSPK